MQSKPDSHTHGVDILDQAGIWCSFICLIHCALTPLVLLSLPTLFLQEDRTHLLLATLLPVLALAAFIPGYRQHRNSSVLATGSAGVLLIWLALLAPKPYAEMALTMSGSLLLIRAHWLNRKLKCTHDRCQKTQVYE